MKKRSAPLEEKDEDGRMSSGTSSKIQRTEVGKSQMDHLSQEIHLTHQEILKLRGERAALTAAWAAVLGTEEKEEKEKALKGAIDKLDDKIQKTKAELKDVRKEFKEAAAMEIDESGGVNTENSAGGDYAKALAEAEKREAGDAKISKFLPMVLLTVCTGFIPGFTEFVKDEAKIMEDKGIKGILIFGRRCFIQVVKEFRRIRKKYIDDVDRLRFCILAGQSGIGKSFAFSQIYMREAFIQREKVAFYSVREATIYLFSIEDGKYKCQEARVRSSKFWNSKAWKMFEDKSAHLIIDPAPGLGHGHFMMHDVKKAYVVYLTSPNRELGKFEDHIKDVRRTTLFVPALAIEESKVIATELKEEESVFLKRIERTGGQLRDFIRKDRYEHFKNNQYYNALKVSSKMFSVQPSTTDETLLYSEKYVMVPQSDFIKKSKMFQVHAEKNLKNSPD
mmetsp:Transcript_34089/g.47477  ORF Transcript_34089/g.47477 Transcript_34089/m.47477 type:complete len:449 (+) Transcript_34089:37-1383(+)